MARMKDLAILLEDAAYLVARIDAEWAVNNPDTYMIDALCAEAVDHLREIVALHTPKG